MYNVSYKLFGFHKNTSGGQPVGGFALWEQWAFGLMPRSRRAGVGKFAALHSQ